MVLGLQSATLHVRVRSKEVAAGGAPQILVYSDAGDLEYLIVPAVFSWRKQEAIIHCFKNQ